MGVYIKGMEMPTEQVLAVINPDGLVEILNSDNILIEEFQATQVPPHGDLISRETAKLYHSYLVDEITDIRVPAIPLSVLNVVPTVIPAEEEI